VKPSELLFLAGMLAVDVRGESVGVGDFDAQADQIFSNIETGLRSAGAGFGNIVQFTTYLVSVDLIPKLMAYRKRQFPKYFPNGVYPPNTLLIVNRLVHAEFLLEVQAIAALS
jgi:enamine deaminase RidA (YjgF/YER057c/UK114 family)